MLDSSRGGFWWYCIGGRIHVYPVACRHEDMMKPGPVGEMGAVLAIELRKAGHVRHALSVVSAGPFPRRAAESVARTVDTPVVPL